MNTKKLYFSILFLFISLPCLGFTLNPDTGKGFKSSKIKISIAQTTCSGAGFSTSQMNSMVKSAINNYWNSVATSSLSLKSKGITAIDIDGDSFNSALGKTTSGEILAGCNNDISEFSDPSILGAAVMDCSGRKCKAVLILNSNDSSLKNMDRSERVAVIAHEIGHAIGLGHSEYTHNLMYYSASGKNQKWLGQDDVDGVSYLYPQDPELMGLLGSCGTISTQKNKYSSFWPSLIIGIMLIGLLRILSRVFLGYRHLLN